MPFVTEAPQGRLPTGHRRRPCRATADTAKTDPRRADQRVRTSRIDPHKAAGHRSCRSFEPLQGRGSAFSKQFCCAPSRQTVVIGQYVRCLRQQLIDRHPPARGDTSTPTRRGAVGQDPMRPRRNGCSTMTTRGDPGFERFPESGARQRITGASGRRRHRFGTGCRGSTSARAPRRRPARCRR